MSIELGKLVIQYYKTSYEATTVAYVGEINTFCARIDSFRIICNNKIVTVVLM